MIETIAVFLILNIVAWIYSMYVFTTMLNRRDEVTLQFKKDENQLYHDLITIDRTLLSVEALILILLKEYDLDELNTFHYRQIVDEIRKNTPKYSSR